MFETSNFLKEELAKNKQTETNNVSNENSVTQKTEATENVSNSEVTENTSNIERQEPSVNNQSTTNQSESVTETANEPVKRVYASEEVAELDAFLRKNPELSLTDYQNLKRPTSSLSEDELIKEFLSVQGGKTEKEIALELKKLTVDSEDDDFDFDDEKNLEAEARRERLLKDAREWRDSYVSEKFSQTQETTSQNEADESQLSVETYLQQQKEQYEKANQDYYTKTFEALQDFSEMQVKIDNEMVSFPVDDTFKKSIQQGLDISSVIKKFYDENGLMKDAKGFVSELAWYLPETREKLIDSLIEQVEARTIANQTKVRRNINLDNQVNVQGNSSSDTNAERAQAFFDRRRQNSF